jgi:hypothetical protein
MKRINQLIALLLCTAAGAFAQKQGDPLPYNKEKLDSLFRSFPPPGQSLVLPVPNTLPAENMKAFEGVNPAATIINKTSSGTVYNMPLDNMAVLVPDMQGVEKMPGSHNFRQAPAGSMPNPLYTPRKKR